MVNLSIIVPVYNTEKYLPKCIESIINQKYGDIEIIIIDDGSVDNSGSICDSYSSQYSFIKCKHISNSGLSNARNVGYSLSSGRYIYFMDSDDELLPGMFANMMSYAFSKNADIVCCSYIEDYENSKVVISDSKQVILLDKEQGMKHFLSRDKIYSQVWTKIYRRDLLEKNNLLFKVGFQTDEDIIFNIQALVYSDTIVIIDIPYYLYKQRQTSLTGSYYRNNIIPFMSNMIYRLTFTTDVVQRDLPSLKGVCIVHCLRYYNYIVGRASKYSSYNESETYYRKALSYIRKHPISLLKNHNDCGVSIIGGLLLLLLTPKAYFNYRAGKG